MGKLIDLTGQRFGRLTVIEKAGSDKKCKDLHCKWLCKCDCGNICIIRGSNLRRGSTKSCGCFNKERVVDANTKHYLSYSKIYKVWVSVKQRCLNSKACGYKNYGSRGITICDEWKDNFQAFYDWAMDNGYKEGLTIDRIDVDGNYCPKNCRWTDAKTQARNTRRNVYITYNGETHCLADWSKIIGIHKDTLKKRLVKAHLSVEEAFNTPVSVKHRTRFKQKEN